MQPHCRCGRQERGADLPRRSHRMDRKVAVHIAIEAEYRRALVNSKGSERAAARRGSCRARTWALIECQQGASGLGRVGPGERLCCPAGAGQQQRCKDGCPVEGHSLSGRTRLSCIARGEHCGECLHDFEDPPLFLQRRRVWLTAAKGFRQARLRHGFARPKTSGGRSNLKARGLDLRLTAGKALGARVVRSGPSWAGFASPRLAAVNVGGACALPLCTLARRDTVD